MQERSAGTTYSAAPAMATCVAGWLLPGLGHVMLRRWWHGFIFMMIVTVMFGLGLYMDGELFRLDGTRPLTLLAGLAEMGVGLPYFSARLLDWGVGQVESVTYEYGYTFLIVAGLLNMLILLDVYDIATGRKP